MNCDEKINAKKVGSFSYCIYGFVFNRAFDIYSLSDIKYA